MNQVYRIATRKTGLSVNELKNVHDAIFNATIKVLQDKKKVSPKKQSWCLYWKNKFSMILVNKEPRSSLNPKTLERVELPQRLQMKFKISKHIKEYLSNL